MRSVAQIIVILTATVLLLPVVAQETTDVVVPDVVGLNAPQAAARLQQLGLRLGLVRVQFAGEGDEARVHRVVEQSPMAGELLGAENPVDVIVLRPANALLVYDDNDITLVHQAGGVLDLSALTFVAENESGSPAFEGVRWQDAGAVQLETGECTQLWSVGRTSAKVLSECDRATYWLTTNDTSEHFWVPGQGYDRFRVIQEDFERGWCEIGGAGRCTLFLENSQFTEQTAYVYLSYSIDGFLIENPTGDRWMRLDGLAFMDTAESEPWLLTDFIEGSASDTPLLDRPLRLAPGQCVLLQTGQQENENVGSGCDAVLRVQVEIAFWQASFSISKGQDTLYRCPQTPQNGATALCILPQ